MNMLQIETKGKPPAQAQKAIVLLHGRGATADDIMTLADEFANDSYHIAAPQAANNAWYPYSFMAPSERNEPWLTEAIHDVKMLIDDLATNISAENIFIMGFSQGACLALEVTARYPRLYGGVVAFSGGLIGDYIDRDKYIGDFKGTKIFIGNSDDDPHIPLERTKESARLLKKIGASVTLNIYPGMQHTITAEEIEDVKKVMLL